VTSPIIQWYPGHIAKAEKQLLKNLEKIDLIIEVRDARIPRSTSHPYIEKWITNKKHLLIINRKDMISSQALENWDQWFKSHDQMPLWCNAKLGDGVKQIKDAAVKAGADLNKRRQLRGMRDRPVRALTLGFPNVGKSALINRLVQKKVVPSSRRAGVTRSLRWIRLGQSIDLLDAPGVLPPRLDDQKSAVKLAICDDIGQAAYDVELVAIAFLKMLCEQNQNAIKIVPILEKRYGITIESNDVGQWLSIAAHQHTSKDLRRMAQKLLDDFRKSMLGAIALELP